jgi:hypothetical protein
MRSLKSVCPITYTKKTCFITFTKTDLGFILSYIIRTFA